MAQYRKKPVVIEAFEWTGGPDQLEDPVWIVEGIKSGVVSFQKNDISGVRMMIETLEGTMVAMPGEWIIRGVKGELYPCKPDIFAATYDAV